MEIREQVSRSRELEEGRVADRVAAVASSPIGVTTLRLKVITDPGSGVIIIATVRQPVPAAAASDIAASDGGGRSGPSVRVSYPIPARGRPGSTPPEDPPALPSVPPAVSATPSALASASVVGTAAPAAGGGTGTPHGPADLPAGFARPPGKAPLLASMGALGTDGEGESIRAKLLEGEFRFEFGVDWIGLGERERERELEKKNAVACLISARPSAIYQLLC